MVTVALVARVGALEGALYTSYRERGEPLVIFSTRENDFIGERPDAMPPWMGVGALAAGTFHVSRHLEQVLASIDAGPVLALGREASRFAAQHLTQTPWISVLSRGEVDVSHGQHATRGLLRQIGSMASVLVVEDHWEMTKAAAAGSRVPHLRLPLMRSAGLAALSYRGTSVAVLRDGSGADDSLVAVLEQICDRRGIRVRSIEMGTLYTRRDLDLGRTLDRALRQRLGVFTHLVMLGDHVGTASVLAALAGQADRVLVEGTLASTALTDRLPGFERARGTALADRLEQMLDTWQVKRRGLGPTAVRMVQRARSRTGVIGFVGKVAGRGLDALEVVWSKREIRRGPQDSCPATWFERVAELDLPWHFEDLWGLGPDDHPPEVDVFFTVGSIQNRTDGARHQRVRNVAEALHRNGPTVVLQPIDALLDRRSLLIADLVERGARPRVLYGENSTSPIATHAMIDRVAGLFAWFGEHGAKRAWFVRDLHWLSEEQPDDYSPSQELVERGLHELRAMAEVTEVFLAPNEASRDDFDALIAAHGVVVGRWGLMPPALEPDNMCQIERIGAGQHGLTLLYSGGMNGFYRQDVFLRAAAQLSADVGFHLDLVVRERDSDFVGESLRASGFGAGSSIRVITDDLSRYVPRTDRVLGVVLLDGRYATRAFPYKTVSMLERGVHVLSYDDSPIADFLEKNGAAVRCERSTSSIVDAAHRFFEGPSEINRSALVAHETWDARIQGLLTVLEVRDGAAESHRSRLLRRSGRR